MRWKTLGATMKDAHALYLDLLGINHDAFAIHLFLVAYYCLEKATHLALELSDKPKLLEVEQLVVQQLDEVKNLLEDSPELVLYQSLSRLITAYCALPQHS